MVHFRLQYGILGWVTEFISIPTSENKFVAEDEDFEPVIRAPAPVNPNKWEGEDEDDEVKVSEMY